jgi:hypothetical protein
LGGNPVGLNKNRLPGMNQGLGPAHRIHRSPRPEMNSGKTFEEWIYRFQKLVYCYIILNRSSLKKIPFKRRSSL